MLSVLLCAVGHCVGYDSFVDLVRAELAGRLEPSRDDIVSAIDSLMRHDILTLVSVEEEAATVLPEVKKQRPSHSRWKRRAMTSILIHIHTPCDVVLVSLLTAMRVCG